MYFSDLNKNNLSKIKRENTKAGEDITAILTKSSPIDFNGNQPPPWLTIQIFPNACGKKIEIKKTKGMKGYAATNEIFSDGSSWEVSYLLINFLFKYEYANIERLEPIIQEIPTNK